MKKIKYTLLILFLSIIIFPSNTFAAGILTVNFKTTFTGDIDLENIGTISIMYADNQGNNANIDLTYNNNFESSISGIMEDKFIIEDIFVLRDYLGKYDIKYNQKKSSDTVLDVDIKVALSNKKDIEPVDINESVYADIIGDKYIESITTSISSYYEEDGYEEWVRTSKPYNEDDNNQSTSTTSKHFGADETTTNEYGQTDKDLEEQSKKIEQSRKEHEKEEEIKKRNNIYIYILLVFIILILSAIVVILIKVSRANK